MYAAVGVTPDTPLADFKNGGRVLRYAKGLDAVHLQPIARLELRESAHRHLDIANYMTPRQSDNEPNNRDCLLARPSARADF